MSVFSKYMSWRDEKMNGPRRDAEAQAQADGLPPEDVQQAGDKAERRRRLSASFGSWIGR